jgi:hypothetical protein
MSFKQVELRKGVREMPREKEFFRDVLADIKESTGKTILTTTDVQKFLKRRYSEARKYMDGQRTITVYQLAQKLL